jgi:Ca2+-binding EF-hand superfamily protein
VQLKLRAAVYGTDPRTFFRKYDRNRGGTLDVNEFKKCIRLALKIPPKDLSDKEIETFARDLDDDGSG